MLLAVTRKRAAARGALALGVRPEHVRLGPEGPVRGTVLAAEYLGTTQIVTLDTAFGEVKVRTAAGERFAPGDRPALAFDARTLTLFDTASGRALPSDANAKVLGHG